MLIISAEETNNLLPCGEPINDLRLVHKSGAEAPLRHYHQISDNAGRDSTLLLMPAWCINLENIETR